ncbi:hypothetical protein [Actinoplanes sp. NPDC049265]|uniref:hypothetical protein n=1 Tax=Actinoplanes sp. NPDC049265 TaxID=3363902 RepID=UPI00371F62BC
MEAVYRQVVERLCAAAADLARTRPGAEGLRAWMEMFVDFMAAKRGLGETQRAVLTSEDDRRQTRDRLDLASRLLDLLLTGIASR